MVCSSVCLYVSGVVLTNGIRMMESQMEPFQSHRGISESNYYPLDGRVTPLTRSFIDTKQTTQLMLRDSVEFSSGEPLKQNKVGFFGEGEKQELSMVGRPVVKKSAFSFEKVPRHFFNCTLTCCSGETGSCVYSASS